MPAGGRRANSNHRGANAPFKKGRWTKFSVLDGLTDRIGRIIFTPDNDVAGHGQREVLLDGREFFSLARGWFAVLDG
jgi:hypothetical protein